MILNLSYHQDSAADEADAVRWAETFGFTPERLGGSPFTLWDGTAFVLRRNA